MLLNIVKIFVIISFFAEIYCMQEPGIKLRFVKCMERGNETVIKIEQTVEEKLYQIFSDINRFLEEEKFTEAKEILKDYCDTFIETIDLPHRKQNKQEYLNELLKVFKIKSKQLVENLHNAPFFNKVESTEDRAGFGLLIAFSIIFVAFLTSETFLGTLAIPSATLVYFSPLVFFCTSIILSAAYIEKEPELVLKFAVPLCFLLIACLRKIYEKRREKDVQFIAIKKIVSNFEEKLFEKIDSYKKIMPLTE